MIRLSIRSTFLAAMLSVAAVASASGTQFVDKSAATASKLVMVARTDSAVMDRYMRHFAMGRAEVISFLGSLEASTLSSDATYKVYGLPNGNRPVETIMKLRAGEPVLVDAQGTPVILIEGGNPLTLGPSARAVDQTVETATSSADALEISTSKNTSLAVTRTQLNAINDALTLTSTDDDDDEAAVVLPSSGGSSAGLIAAAAGVAAIAVIASQNNNNSLPVPEPASMAVLGLGIAALRRRKNKKS